MLSKQKILIADDLSTEIMDIPEWGGQIKIKEMTGSERDMLEQSTYTQKGDDFQMNLKDIRARLCAICIIDENNERLFEDSDIQELSKKSSKVLDRIFEVCQRINGLKKEELDEMAKN